VCHVVAVIACREPVSLIEHLFCVEVNPGDDVVGLCGLHVAPAVPHDFAVRVGEQVGASALCVLAISCCCLAGNLFQRL
jgi:hypothetical protein